MKLKSVLLLILLLIGLCAVSGCGQKWPTAGESQGPEVTQ